MPPKEHEHGVNLNYCETETIEPDAWIGALADYLIEFATPAFEHQDKKLLEKVLFDYFS